MLFKERYNIDQMYEALISYPNVYLVSAKNQALNGESEVDIIIRYIKEHYTENVNVQEVKNFNEQIYVYKLGD